MLVAREEQKTMLSVPLRHCASCLKRMASSCHIWAEGGEGSQRRTLNVRVRSLDLALQAPRSSLLKGLCLWSIEKSN